MRTSTVITISGRYGPDMETDPHKTVYECRLDRCIAHDDTPEEALRAAFNALIESMDIPLGSHTVEIDVTIRGGERD